MAQRSRARQSAADMARSLGLLLLVVLPAVLMWSLLGPSARTEAPPVDPARAMAAAEAAGVFAVAAPVAVPQAWVATSAAYEVGAGSGGGPAVLRLGYLTERSEFVGFTQTAEPIATVLERFDGPTPLGTVPAGGGTWQRFRTDRDEVLLVRETSDSVLVVTGSESEQALLAFAAAVPR